MKIFIKFDLEAAKKGAPVMTRSGKKVRIVCFDLKSKAGSIVGLVDEGDHERCLAYTEKGKFILNDNRQLDLVMRPLEHRGKGGILKYYKDLSERVKFDFDGKRRMDYMLSDFLEKIRRGVWVYNFEEMQPNIEVINFEWRGLEKFPQTSPFDYAEKSFSPKNMNDFRVNPIKNHDRKIGWVNLYLIYNTDTGECFTPVAPDIFDNRYKALRYIYPEQSEGVFNDWFKEIYCCTVEIEYRYKNAPKS